MSVNLQIEGMSDFLRWTERAPDDMVKLAKVAMREGAKRVVISMRPQINERWKRLLKYKVSGGRNDKDLACDIGLFNGRQRQGHQPASGDVDDWFKAYWMNYGTLARRDPNHVFMNPVQPASRTRSQRRRNRVGQPHQNFLEKAMLGYEDVFFNAFSQKIADNIEDCYER